MSNKKITAPKGTHDVLPDRVHVWQFLERQMLKTCSEYGYKQIRFPVFEHTELFNRGVGDTTDVVQKEMYTFLDKGNRSITLRPEGTASTARSYIENNLYANPLPVKLFYTITCYRYERPQAGRYREFNQFGVENFGSASPLTDAEVISLAMLLLKRLGVEGLTLYINSIGCPECRKKYNETLKAFLRAHEGGLCELCRDRMERNPLRVLDCKNPDCQAILKDAPTVDSVLCDDCIQHFSDLKKYLTDIGIAYEVDTSLVRGLDYYTRTVFEIKSGDLGAQSTVCGGGRYDGLVEQLGGAPTPGIGFSMGVERLINILEKQNKLPENTAGIEVFVGAAGEKAKEAAFRAVYALREKGISAEFDHVGKSVKAQMKYADKIGAKYSTVIGDDELEKGIVNLKNMQNGEITEIALSDLLGGKING